MEQGSIYTAIDPQSCRLLKPSEVNPAADVISTAFLDDPLCTFMLPNRKTRLSALKKFFRAYCHVSIQNRRGYGVGMPLKGVAFWMPPNKPDLSINVRSLRLFLPLLFTAYPLGYVRARKILVQTDVLHQKYAPEPHYYLDNIGVLPSERGQGKSSALIRPFLKKADEEKVIAYTDTVTRENVPLYEHFEFQLMEQCGIPGTGLTVWALRRPFQ